MGCSRTAGIEIAKFRSVIRVVEEIGQGVVPFGVVVAWGFAEDGVGLGSGDERAEESQQGGNDDFFHGDCFYEKGCFVLR